jgi:hypothetical protein
METWHYNRPAPVALRNINFLSGTSARHERMKQLFTGANSRFRFQIQISDAGCILPKTMKQKYIVKYLKKTCGRRLTAPEAMITFINRRKKVPDSFSCRG